MTTVSRGAYLGSPDELSVITKIAITIVVAFTLLIIYTTVSNLFFSKTAGREKELGIKLALGASAYRLIQQLLTERILTCCSA